VLGLSHIFLFLIISHVSTILIILEKNRVSWYEALFRQFSTNLMILSVCFIQRLTYFFFLPYMIRPACPTCKTSVSNVKSLSGHISHCHAPMYLLNVGGECLAFLVVHCYYFKPLLFAIFSDSVYDIFHRQSIHYHKRARCTCLSIRDMHICQAG
jgi:hypothetical protein